MSLDASGVWSPDGRHPAPGVGIAVSTTNGVLTGSGSPEGVVTADPGTLYNQIVAGVMVAQWTKATGVGTNTGW